MRPFKVLGIQQIAIGGEDKKLLARFWIDLMGLKKVKSFVSESENVDEDVLSIGEGPHAVEVDIMQPVDPEKNPGFMNLS
jgi:lactoylglutathione lyase